MACRGRERGFRSGLPIRGVYRRAGERGNGPHPAGDGDTRHLADRTRLLPAKPSASSYRRKRGALQGTSHARRGKPPRRAPRTSVPRLFTTHPRLFTTHPRLYTTYPRLFTAHPVPFTTFPHLFAVGPMSLAAVPCLLLPIRAFMAFCAICGAFPALYDFPTPAYGHSAPFAAHPAPFTTFPTPFVATPCLLLPFRACFRAIVPLTASRACLRLPFYGHSAPVYGLSTLLWPFTTCPTPFAAHPRHLRSSRARLRPVHTLYGPSRACLQPIRAFLRLSCVCLQPIRAIYGFPAPVCGHSAPFTAIPRPQKSASHPSRHRLISQTIPQGERRALPAPAQGTYPLGIPFGKRPLLPPSPRPPQKRRRRQVPARGLAAVYSHLRPIRNETQHPSPPTRGAWVREHVAEGTGRRHCRPAGGRPLLLGRPPSIRSTAPIRNETQNARPLLVGRGVRRPRANGTGRPHCGHSRILVTTPEPTVRPPSRMAKRRPSSHAIGVIKVISMSMLSPGMTISTPSGSLMLPVTSVVRK